MTSTTDLPAMALRLPPGRAGRIWLERRLELARRGADVLDRKRRALLRLERALRSERSTAEAEWETAARDAATWLARAATLSGDRRLALATLYAPGPVDVRITWRSTLGVAYPASCELAPSAPTDVSALGGSAAVTLAARAHRRALEAGARYAVARTAHDRIVRELATVAARTRAIERRWIPAHREALARLSMALDEAEREEIVRTRRIAAGRS